jgi:hypothetical protein
MSRPSSQQQIWSDAQLADAIKASASWRGVMRELGLNATSAGAVRIVRRHATRLGLDTSHFRGKRGWSDAQLRRAVLHAQSWEEVLTALGLSAVSGSARTHVKSQAIRLGLDLSNLGRRVTDTPVPGFKQPDLKYLRQAGGSIAASWFTLCGYSVSFPVEPTTFDLLATAPEGIRRIQVKTTTYKSAHGWQVSIGRRPYSAGNLARLTPYDPDEIDFFFVIDGDLAMYLIPSRVVAGRVVISLRAYTNYIVGDAGGLLGQSPLTSLSAV